MPKLKVLRSKFNDVHDDVIRMYRSQHGRIVKSGRFILVKHGDVETVMIYRGPLEDQHVSTVHMDYHNRSKLGVEVAAEAELSFSKPSLLQIARWALDAPDVATRIAFKLSMLSIILGVIGSAPTVSPIIMAGLESLWDGLVLIWQFLGKQAR